MERRNGRIPRRGPGRPPGRRALIRNDQLPHQNPELELPHPYEEAERIAPPPGDTLGRERGRRVPRSELSPAAL